MNIFYIFAGIVAGIILVILAIGTWFKNRAEKVDWWTGRKRDDDEINK